VLEPVLVGCETGLLDFGEVSLAYEIEIRPLSAGALEVTAEARPHTGSIDANPDDNTQVETTTVNASVPELSGQITFMSTRTGPAVLHTKDLGTGTVAMFLAGGLQVFGEDPSWSSDGSQIAIGGGSLRLIASNGSNAPVTLPIGDLFSPRHPRWSPDGMKIVFQAVDDGDPDQDWELFVIDVATTAITRLTNNAVPDEAPDWAPDGSNRILFTRHCCGRQRHGAPQWRQHASRTLVARRRGDRVLAAARRWLVHREVCSRRSIRAHHAHKRR
jgi:hypothetical protein